MPIRELVSRLLGGLALWLFSLTMIALDLAGFAWTIPSWRRILPRSTDRPPRTAAAEPAALQAG